MALHMEFDGGRTATPMYWKHTALEAQQENATAPPIYGRLDGLGFFGLYLESGGGGGSQRVDVLSFDTFALNLAGVFRRMTLDDDGNLRAYYCTSDAKAWTSDYKAIAERCELPTSCGAYGLCVPGKAECQCLDDNSTSAPAAADAPPCHAEETTGRVRVLTMMASPSRITACAMAPSSSSASASAPMTLRSHSTCLLLVSVHTRFTLA